MADEASPIVPGPCPSTGCPPPTEIVCIEVTKVYDFCFQSESRENICFPIPASCGTVPPGTTATGTVTSVTCSTQSISPIPSQPGFANVTLLITVTESLTLTAPDGTTLCTFSGQFFFLKTVTLCAPTGVSVTCSAPASAVGPCVIIGSEVCCTVNICLLIQSAALVKLLVPSYGFCVPAPCVVAPSPPFPCPPSPLFPPQCAPVV
jgi:hypothetical protein